MPMITMRDARSLQAALEAANVEFVPESGSGTGVRLRKSKL